MLFTFKRSPGGRESIHVGDVCIAVLSRHVQGRVDVIPGTVVGLQEHHVHDAIERADEAGFWNLGKARADAGTVTILAPLSIDVDVPVTDNAVLTVETEGDES